ncbi:MAG TPA: hypothetical protein DEA79_25255 [Cyanobacteria bacterium UBA11153]|nr:hypothetical protein [Cyanobacteria bacterium UBA11153]
MEVTVLKNKPLFIGLSCLSLFSLVSSFAYPLQKLEVWKQNEVGTFGIEYQKNFIITENDRDYPYGFNSDRATKVAQIHQDYKIEKIFFLFVAIITASFSLYLGNDVVASDEISSEINRIKSEGRKQLILEGIKHQLALASKSQRLLFLDEMKIMMEEFGRDELESVEIDEYLAIGEVENDELLEITQTSDFRSVFPESMDGTCWKAISKGISDGLSDEEIIKDTLDCDLALGKSYLEYLKQRFW